MSTTLADAKAVYARYVAELEAITDRNEGRDEMRPGDQQRYKDICRAMDKAEAKLSALESSSPSGPSPAERQAVIAKIRADDINTPPPPPAARAAGFNVNRGFTGSDIFDRSGLHVEDERDGETYRSKALAAIDGWRTSTPEQKASAAALVNDPFSPRDRQVADLHVLSAGHPLYSKAFRSMIKADPHRSTQESQPRDPDERAIFADVNSRALSESTIGAGLALVPPWLDPTIVITGQGAEPVAHPFRDLATVKKITTKTYLGVSSPGITAEFGQEATEAVDAAPTFSGIVITPVKMDAFVPVSNEWLADAADATEQLLTMFQDAASVLEATAWVTGTGLNQTPQGVMTALDLTTASRTSTATAGTFGLVDAFQAYSNLPARFRPNSRWIGSDILWNQFRQTATPASTVDRLPWVEFEGTGTPAKLIGREVYPTSGMPSTQTSGADVAIVGDFRAGAVICDRIGLGIIVYQPNALIGPQRRPIGSTAIYAVWRSTIQIVAPQAFQMIRVS